MGIIQFRRGTRAQGVADNKTYDQGEPIYETDSKSFLIADGSTPYPSLSYPNAGTLNAPIPSEDTSGATDGPALLAAISAATTAGLTLDFGDGTYWVAEEIAFTCSYRMTPNTVIKAAATYTGVLCSTPKGTRVDRLTFAGGVFDSNGTAQSAFWAHQATNCNWVLPEFRNSVQDDFLVGDPTDTGYSYGNSVLVPNWNTTAGQHGPGYANLYLTSYATDNQIYQAQGGVREIGIRVDGGDNKFFGPHMSNGCVTAFLDNGSNNVWIAPIPDTPGNVTHAGATAASGVSVITDTSISTAHAGLPISGTNIPNGAYVGTVTAGTSFTLVNASGGAVTTTGSVSGITLQGVGFNLQGSDAKYISSGTAINNTSTGTNATCSAICIGPNIPLVHITGWRTAGGDSSHQWKTTFTGLLTVLSYLGLHESNVIGPASSTNELQNLITEISTLNPFVGNQTVNSGTAFTPNSNRDIELAIPVATSTSGTITLTMGPSTGSENTVLSSITATVGQVITVRVPATWKVIITLTSCTLGTVKQIAC